MHGALAEAGMTNILDPQRQNGLPEAGHYEANRIRGLQQDDNLTGSAT